MQQKAQTSKSTTTRRSAASHPMYMNEKKTAFIIVTVIGCIAILWPKVLYPMLFGGPAPPTTTNPLNEQRGPSGGCCDVVLDREQFLNSTPLLIGPQLFRKQLNLLTGEMSLRQERPAHLHPESIYQAMRERGRAIPITPTVPIVDRKGNPPPRIVEGRPGPIPGMRPPMGAGAVHQPQAKGTSMGFIMPLYTIGIIVFFGYTIMKLVCKKPVQNAPYGPSPTDPNFRKEVFGQENGRQHVEDLNGSKIVVTAIQGLIDAADEQLKLDETTITNSTKKSNHNSTTSNNDDTSPAHTNDVEQDEHKTKLVDAERSQSKAEEQRGKPSFQRKRREGSIDRSVEVLGMEVTASCEDGQKWTGRPPTPVFRAHNEHSKDLENMPEPKSIYLEGSLAHDSQILVADSETKSEEIYDEELNGSAVVLSSKMTLSLINLDSILQNESNEIESPLGDDIEIIGHDE